MDHECWLETEICTTKYACMSSILFPYILTVMCFQKGMYSFLSYFFVLLPYFFKPHLVLIIRHR